jgi:hypothetical protein
MIDLNDGRYVINSEAQMKLYKTMQKNASTEPKDLGREWHSDCLSPIVLKSAKLMKYDEGTFEPCPADFSFLLMQETPDHGGDTLWCSGYELYTPHPPYLPAHPDIPSLATTEYPLPSEATSRL